MEIKIERTKHPKTKPADESKLGFGHIFTDYMLVTDNAMEEVRLK